MVGWFEPGQLLDTGIKALVSSVIGQHSDRRLLEALQRPDLGYYDYTCHYRERADGALEPDPARPRNSLWLDYVADVGDGWNSTYAVAYHLAQPKLMVGLGGEEHFYATERGELLILGGDEVYPTPSRREYEQRLVEPYAAAFGDAQPLERPHVFAIPGNHDWYDSLVARSRQFCSSAGGRRFAGWRTPQARSYFALRLPQRWWLFAADGQLQSDIDAAQIEYFRGVAQKHVQTGDRVILCLGSPSWIYAHKYARYGGEDEGELLELLRGVLRPRGVEVKLFLSGDLHHYRRHEELDAAEPNAPVQKVTASGGGAFLHPTFGENVALLAELPEPGGQPGRRFALRASFPSPERSRRLVWGNLLFVFKNPWFGILPGTLYLLGAWIMGATLRWQPPRGMLHALLQTARALRDNPDVFLVFASVLAAFVFFTDTRSPLYKWIGGLLHAFTHYAALFYLGWGSVISVYWWFPESPLLQLLVGASLVFWLGWVLGSIIVGLYQLLSLAAFGRHSQEAFSSLRIEDYKNFLRLRIAEDGSLTLYAIGIERVPRRWRARLPEEAEDVPSRFEPEDGTPPRLIEPPLRWAGAAQAREG